MNDVEFYTVIPDSCSDVEDDMKWLLTIGVTRDGAYYCSIGLSGSNVNWIIGLATMDGIPVLIFEDHVYVPMDWLREKCSQAKPAVDRLERVILSANLAFGFLKPEQGEKRVVFDSDSGIARKIRGVNYV